jgi:hypothetical protein
MLVQELNAQCTVQKTGDEMATHHHLACSWLMTSDNGFLSITLHIDESCCLVPRGLNLFSHDFVTLFEY